MALPVVDFADFVDGPDSSRKAIGQRLVASFKKHGFVKLINHEIPESVVKDLSEWVMLPIVNRMHHANWNED